MSNQNKGKKDKNPTLKTITFTKQTKQNNRIRVNVRLSEIVKSDIMLALAKEEGYTLKDMSTWVQEATKSLTTNKYCQSILIQTAINSRNDPAGKLTSINLDMTLWKNVFKISLKASLEACTRDKEKVYINIPVSTFLRAAIIQRLYS